MVGGFFWCFDLMDRCPSKDLPVILDVFIAQKRSAILVHVRSGCSAFAKWKPWLAYDPLALFHAGTSLPWFILQLSTSNKVTRLALMSRSATRTPNRSRQLDGSTLVVMSSHFRSQRSKISFNR